MKGYISERLTYLWGIPKKDLEEIIDVYKRNTKKAYEVLIEKIMKIYNTKIEYAREIAEGVIRDIKRMIENKSWEYKPLFGYPYGRPFRR